MDLKAPSECTGLAFQQRVDSKNPSVSHCDRCVEVVRFIKENSVGTFLTKIRVSEQGGDGEGARGGGTASAEEAMMDRMGILVVCRFERLLVEEQVRRYGYALNVLMKGH